MISEKIIRTKKSNVKGVCNAHGCRNKTNKRFCGTHYRHAQRITNELMYCFGNLKQNAKRRGIAFELTESQFRAFCEQTGYLEMRGRSSGALTIDRIDNAKGYTIKNIRAIPLRANVIKSWFDRNREAGESLPVPPIDVSGIVKHNDTDTTNCPI